MQLKNLYPMIFKHIFYVTKKIFMFKKKKNYYKYKNKISNMNNNIYSNHNFISIVVTLKLVYTIIKYIWGKWSQKFKIFVV